MSKKGCSCSDKNSGMACQLCNSDMPLPYWCDTCRQLVPEKRCPDCGLKTRKVRQSG